MLKAAKGQYSIISEVSAITTAGSLSTQAKKKVRHFVPPIVGAPQQITPIQQDEVSVDDLSSALSEL